MAKTNIGKMACETCGNHVTVKSNENGTLSYRCDECDAAPYAKTGTIQNTKWREKLGAEQSPEVKKPVDTPPMEKEKPAKQTVGDIWGIK